MSYFRKNWKQILRNMRFYLIATVVFVVMAILGLNLLQTKLLQNAQNTGMTLARSCSIEEQNNVTVYETMMHLGTQYIGRQLEQDAQEEALQDWIQNFFTNITAVMGTESIDPYAVVDGKIYAANPWEGDDSYDTSATEWYQKAMDANGGIIFTDAYIDAVYQKPVITIAQKIGTFNAVLAFDIFPENFRLHNDPLDMPEDSVYYLCDHQGTLLYAQGLSDNFHEDLQPYLNDLLAGIASGELYSYDSYIYDYRGNKRGVYYWELENGWISIITIPYSTIFSSLLQTTIIFSIGFSAFLLMLILMAWKDYHLNKRMSRVNETVQVLGNSYYAIYRLDYQLGTYEIIKGTDAIRQRIPHQGKYEYLLGVMKEFIESSAYSDFLESFSMQSIRQLVAHQTRDFGGDFQRLFGNEYKWVNVRLLFDSTLAPGEVVLCFREVDQEKRQQLQQQRLLETALDTARRSEKAKNTFFSSMSHDMRTPLNAIIGMSELARQNRNNPDKVDNYIQKINFSSRQLLNLINDILEMSRLEQGKVSLDYQQFDLRKCVEDCAAPFLALAEQEQKTFTISFDIENSMVMGDFFRIGQILNNLLSNAFKYSLEGAKIDLRIRQFQQQDHTKYQIVVEDTGLGMSAEFVGKIFEPYARETRFGAKNISGTGLGMPIVKSLVSQMSGQITVESELGKGSIFTVTIPLETVKQTDTEVVSETSLSDFCLAGRKILLAEDNDFNMEIATEILTMNNIEVTQAWNGVQAVEAFKASPPFFFDAILMDMQMPEMDGCEATRTIRSLNRPDATLIPIIAVTANAFAEDIAMTTEAGMNAHISKPIDFSILYRTLENLIPNTHTE